MHPVHKRQALQLRLFFLGRAGRLQQLCLDLLERIFQERSDVFPMQCRTVCRRAVPHRVRCRRRWKMHCMHQPHPFQRRLQVCGQPLRLQQLRVVLHRRLLQERQRVPGVQHDRVPCWPVSRQLRVGQRRRLPRVHQEARQLQLHRRRQPLQYRHLLLGLRRGILQQRQRLRPLHHHGLRCGSVPQRVRCQRGQPVRGLHEPHPSQRRLQVCGQPLRLQQLRVVLQQRLLQERQRLPGVQQGSVPCWPVSRQLRAEQ